MSRPADWYNLSPEQQRAWRKADAEREQIEWDQQQAEQKAEQAHRDARRAAEQARIDRAIAAEEVQEATDECRTLQIQNGELLDMIHRLTAAVDELLYNAASPPSAALCQRFVELVREVNELDD